MQVKTTHMYIMLLYIGLYEFTTTTTFCWISCQFLCSYST